jgi:hypothetical protein
MATIQFQGLFFRIDRYIVTDVSRECSAFVFRAKQSNNSALFFNQLTLAALGSFETSVTIRHRNIPRGLNYFKD